MSKSVATLKTNIPHLKIKNMMRESDEKIN